MAAFDPSERELIESLGIGTPSGPDLMGTGPAQSVNDFEQQYRDYRNTPEMLALRRQWDAEWEAQKGNSLLGKVFQVAVPAALPFLGPALGLGALASAGLGAATGAGWSAASGADPLIGGLTGGIGGGIAALPVGGAAGPISGVYNRIPDVLQPSLTGSLNATASGFGAYQDRPDYDPSEPEVEEPPPLDILIGAPPAPPVDIPPPRLPEEGPVGGGGGGAPAEPTPGSGGGVGEGAQDGSGTGGTDNPPIFDDPNWQYVGRDEEGYDIYVGNDGQIERVPTTGGAEGPLPTPQPQPEPQEPDLDVVPVPDAGGSGDGQGSGSGAGSGSGTGGGSGDGDGSGSGSGDGSGDGSGRGMDLGSALGLMGLMGRSPGRVTAETPEAADIKIYDLENLFGVSGLDSLYNAPFRDELSLITEELLKAARERRA